MRLFALLAAGLFVGAVMAAPVPKEKEKGTLYFSVTKGTKCVLTSKLGRTTTELTETVTKVAEKDGVFTVTVETTQDDGQTSTRAFDVSDKGVFLRTVGKLERKEPTPLLKLGGKAGDSWTAGIPGIVPGKGVVTTDTTFTLGDEEEVVVPAGKYKAIRVTEEMPTDRGPASKSQHWYAPGVGLVKRVSTFAGRETTVELKSFTPGKDEKKDDKTDGKKVKDEEAILGMWKLVKIDDGSGREHPANLLAKMSMTFKKDGKMIGVNPDGTTKELEYKLDPTAKVKAIDVTPSADKTSPGVYELDGDTLTLCMGKSGNDRPSELKADSKAEVVLITLKRVKDEKKDK